MIRIALAILLIVVRANFSLALTAPDTVVVTGTNFQQLTAGQIMITPTGGAQTTLAAALAGSGSSVTWPSSASLVISNGTNAPAGLAPVNGDCVIGSGGVWTAGSCGGGSSVSSVSNSDGSLAFFPTTGGVIGSLVLSNANTWTATQTYSTLATSGADNLSIAGNVITESGSSNGFEFKSGPGGSSFLYGSVGSSSTATLGFAGSSGSTLLINPGTNGLVNIDGAAETNSYLLISPPGTITSGTSVGANNASPAGIWEQSSYTGSIIASATPNMANFISVNDTVVANATYGWSAMQFNAQANTGYDGDHNGFIFTMTKNAPSVTSSGNGFAYGGVNLFGRVFAPDNNSTASFTNFNPDVTCSNVNGGGNNFGGCIDAEFDVRNLLPGLIKKVGIGVHYAGAQGSSPSNIDTYHGSSEDCAFCVTASMAVPIGGGGLVAYQIGSFGGAWPLDPTASGTAIIRAAVNTSKAFIYAYQPYATYGVDLGIVNFKSGGYAWRSSGDWVDPDGNTYLGPGLISHSASGLSISVPNVTMASATVAAGGTAYNVGDELIDTTYYSLWSVATLSGSAVATVTLLHAGYPASCSGLTSVATVGGNGTGATLNISCTGSLALSLGGASQSVVVASGATFGIPQLTPASSSAACVTGTVSIDASFLYECTATNTWKRVALSTF